MTSITFFIGWMLLLDYVASKGGIRGFTRTLAHEVGNPLLAEMQRSVHQLWVEAWSECRIAPGDWRQFYAEHLAILEALERGDGGLARRLMADHVDRTIEKAAVLEHERGGG